MPSTSANAATFERLARRLATLTVLGAGVLVASMWLHRVKPVSFEDYYGTYGGRLGIPKEIPQDRELAGLPGWFFAFPAAGQVLLAALAARVAMIARLRPQRLVASGGLGVQAAVIGCVLALWVLGAVVLFPGLDAPPLRAPGRDMGRGRRRSGGGGRALGSRGDLVVAQACATGCLTSPRGVSRTAR